MAWVAQAVECIEIVVGKAHVEEFIAIVVGGVVGCVRTVCGIKVIHVVN